MRLPRQTVRKMSEVLITMSVLEDMYPSLLEDGVFQQTRKDLEGKMKAHLRATSEAARVAAESSERVKNARLGRL